MVRMVRSLADRTFQLWVVPAGPAARVVEPRGPGPVPDGMLERRLVPSRLAKLELLNPSIPKAQERKHFHGKKYFRFVCRDLLMYAFH